jgi:glycosyltransferase involved in cell wall biosynthesis
VSGPRVLFVNHTGEIAGAERSLLDLLDGLRGRAELAVACPSGELFEDLRRRDVEVEEIPETTLSFRPHPTHTPRGLAQLAGMARRLGDLAPRLGASVLHANTERAGLAATLLRRRARPPLVVHARAPFPANRVGTLTARTLRTRSNAIIANSRYTAEGFSGGGRTTVDVVHNPVDCRRFDPAEADRDAARRRFGIDDERPLLTVIGYLAPIKRQDDAIRILAHVRRDHPDAQLLVVGAPRFTAAGARSDNSAYADDLRGLTRELGLEGEVLFVGELDDVRDALAATDLLLVPSQREGFGRVALEGLAMGVPVIATAVGGTGEIIRDGVDGLLLEPEDPSRWAAAATALLADAARRSGMGERGRTRAMDAFSMEAHADAVLAIYERVREA